MQKLRYKKKLKLSNDLKIGDDFRVGGCLVTVEDIKVNDHDELVLHLDIVGARFKKYSKAMLIFPKKTPVITLVVKS